MNDLFWFTIVLFIIAAVLRSELFFYLLYVLMGLQLLIRLWQYRGRRNIHWRRNASPTMFPGEATQVEVEITNKGLLPIPWLSFYESLPPDLHTPPMIRQVLSLGAGERKVISYTLMGQRRGYYRLGPLTLRTGDVLGLNEQTLGAELTSNITVYPHILSLAALGLPASLPYGTLAASQRLFSDPARPAGVRPYQPGDGLRRIDWKSSARSGELQVRRSQPSIALETLIALAFSREEYGGRFAYEAMEHALVAAASIAAYLSEQRQPVGLYTTGLDPAAGTLASPLAPADGRAHLMTLLGVLGRLEAVANGSIVDMLTTSTAQLGWGSTVVLITGQRGPELISALLPLKRRGLNVALIMPDASPADLGLPRQYGITTYTLERSGRPVSA